MDGSTVAVTGAIAPQATATATLSVSLDGSVSAGSATTGGTPALALVGNATPAAVATDAPTC